MNEETSTRVRKLAGELKQLSALLRRDIDEIDDPQADALLETSAEVIDGLRAAFRHYQNKSERAWQAK